MLHARNTILKNRVASAVFNFRGIFRLLVICLLCFRITDAEWTKQASGTLASLNSVYFSDEKRGWIAGSNGTLLTTFNGGITWTATRMANRDNLLDVYFADAKNGWVLCERNIFSLGTASPSYLLRTKDGGSTWEKFELLNSSERAVRFYFQNSGAGYAVGESGTFWRWTTRSGTWTKYALPVRNLILAGSFQNGPSGVLVGTAGTILTTENDGDSWKQRVLPDGARTKLKSVFFIDRLTGWTGGESGRIYYSDNGGRSWRPQISGTAEAINDLYFRNAQEGIAVSDKGIILHTTNAGDNWKIEVSDTANRLEKVFLIGDRAFAVGFGGTILTYKLESAGQKVGSN